MGITGGVQIGEHREGRLRVEDGWAGVGESQGGPAEGKHLAFYLGTCASFQGRRLCSPGAVSELSPGAADPRAGPRARRALCSPGWPSYLHLHPARL